MITAGLLIAALVVIGIVLVAGAALWGYWWLCEPKPQLRGFDVLPPQVQAKIVAAHKPKEEPE